MPNFPPSDHSGYAAATMVPDAGLLSELTDDECLLRLAQAIETENNEKFEEIAMLIGRLAITIE